MEKDIKKVLYSIGCSQHHIEEQTKILMDVYNKKIETTIHEREKIRLVRDEMIHRIRISCGIESQELKIIEEEIIKKVNHNITEEQLETICFWFHKHFRYRNYDEKDINMWKAIDELEGTKYKDAMKEALQEIGIKIECKTY